MKLRKLVITLKFRINYTNYPCTIGGVVFIPLYKKKITEIESIIATKIVDFCYTYTSYRGSHYKKKILNRVLVIDPK